MKTTTPFLRPGLIACGLAILLLVNCGDALAAKAEVPVSLAGTWRFSLDRDDRGLSEQWFNRTLAGKIRLPGALQNQGFGDDITVDTKWTGDVGSDRWRQGPEYAPYRQPGNIKIPFFLQPEKHYVGAAWYQRDIVIPKSWAGRRVALTLERPHWGTQVWLDRRLLGTNISLSTPHVYELGVDLRPGRHTLTIRVDNRILVEVGDWSHSVSDHTQGNWNGVIGRIELAATDRVWIEEVQVFPEAASKTARILVSCRNAAGAAAKGRITFSVEQAGARAGLPVSQSFDTGDAEFSVDSVALLGAGTALWDEFNPALCRARVEVTGEAGGRPFEDVRAVTFGLRSVAATNRQFRINQRPVFFRGTLECCIFPRTGHPPTDVAAWRRIIRVCQAHGLNHIRFHSWCPPEAAFIAADGLGFYYQVECGVWTQPGNGKSVDQWIHDESRRIVRAYGNHPSFVLLTHGNEPHGPRREEYLAKWVDFWKRDGRFLVTSGSAYPQLPQNQYHVFHPSRGPHGWLGKDYRRDVEKLDVPVIVHEMGQWCVYPDFDEIRKYTGPLKARNFEIFRDSLAGHGLLDQRKEFLRASGALQVLCYKEEIEAALRTPGIGGVQLLDLHDFPGQGTALVGVLDPFWDSKGYVTPKEFRRFCGPVVPLARLLKRTWTTAETLTCEVECANFAAAPVEKAVLRWSLRAGDGKAVARGEFPAQTLALGQNIPLGRIRIDLARVAGPEAYRLAVSVATGTGKTVAENDWNLWVYPATPPRTASGVVRVTARLDAEALSQLDAGGSVLLFPGRLSRGHPKLTFEPIFWNRYMFNTQNRQTLGLLCDPGHPALAQFPTADFQDWQWRDIVTDAQAMVLDDLPAALRPIIQPIDDWNTNRKLGLLFECVVGRGRLLVCSADLDRQLDERPAARQLRESLLRYVEGGRFRPAVRVSKEDLARLLEHKSPSNLVRLGARILSADSEDAENGHTAANAIDGDPQTIWHTRWQPAADPMPHQFVIDLGRATTLTGITCLPRQDMANGRVASVEVFLSNDPAAWGAPAASATWRNVPQLQTLRLNAPIRARYLKFVARSEVNGNPFAAVAELDVQEVPP